MVNTMNLEGMTKFYEAVFQKAPDMAEDKYKGWSVGSTFFSLGEHDQMKGKSKDGARVLINFESSDVRGEFERIKDIEGVEVVKEPYNMSPEGGEGAGDFWIATLADPDGNYFQLMSPWEPQ